VKTFIASPHLGDKWKKIQGEFVQLYTTDYTLFQYDVPGCSHLKSLKTCVKFLVDSGSSGDLLVIMDSDAFPIAEWQERVLTYLEEGNEFVAIQRLENPYWWKEIAHPSFCAWKYGTDIFFDGASTPYIYGYLTRKWKKLHRTNVNNLHEIMYGIYDNFIYHHGAGSRGDIEKEAYFSPGLKWKDDIFNDPMKFISTLRGRNDS